MSLSKIVALKSHLDPWAKLSNPQRVLPADFDLVCLYELDVGLGCLDELVLLHRTDQWDELWTATADWLPLGATVGDLIGIAGGAALVAKETRAGSRPKAAYRLLSKLIRSRTGHAWPSSYRAGQLVNQRQFQQLLSDLKAGFEGNQIATREKEAPIVEVARDLGLDPQADARRPGFWNARCPSGNHTLLINNETNDFYCGYCIRRGDAGVLTAFKQNPRGQAGKVRRKS